MVATDGAGNRSQLLVVLFMVISTFYSTVDACLPVYVCVCGGGRKRAVTVGLTDQKTRKERVAEGTCMDITILFPWTHSVVVFCLLQLVV